MINIFRDFNSHISNRIKRILTFSFLCFLFISTTLSSQDSFIGVSPELPDIEMIPKCDEQTTNVTYATSTIPQLATLRIAALNSTIDIIEIFVESEISLGNESVPLTQVFPSTVTDPNNQYTFYDFDYQFFQTEGTSTFWNALKVSVVYERNSYKPEGPVPSLRFGYIDPVSGIYVLQQQRQRTISTALLIEGVTTVSQLESIQFGEFQTVFECQGQQIQDIALNGTLIIDQNSGPFCFETAGNNSDRTSIIMGQNARIIVEDGVDANFKQIDIINCPKVSTPHDGVIVNGGQLTFDDVYVTDATTAITANAGSILSVENSTFENNFKGIVIDGNVDVVYHGGNTYTQSAPLLSGVPDAYCGIQMLDNPGVNELSDCANPNSYSDMQYGIVSRNSFARVTCDGFDNLSSSGIEAYGVGQGVNTLFAFNNTFDDCKTGIYTNTSHLFAQQNILNNCQQGFYAQNNNVLNWVHENVINGSLRGVTSWLNGSLSLRDNDIHAENNSPVATLGYGVLDFISSGSFITNNIVDTEGCESGIELNRCNSDSVNENTVTGSSNIVGRDIALLAGSNHGVSCNYTGLNNSDQSTESAGILVDMTDRSTISCNTTDDVEVGLHIRNDASGILVRGNAFENDNLGLQVEFSMIGEQTHEGNLWFGNGNSANQQAHIAGSDFQISNSNFLVNAPVGTPLHPVNNQPGENWFENLIGNTFNCQGCTGGVGAQPTPFINQNWLLEGLCKELQASDTLSCEQKWLKQYNLYAYIKSTIDDSEEIRNDCINAFLLSSEGTTFEQFYFIDSLLQVDSDNLSRDEVVMIEDIVSTPKDDKAISTFEQWMEEQIVRDDTQTILLAKAELQQVRDTCSVETIWKDVYELQIKQRLESDLSPQDIQRLATISQLCLSDYGQAVYLARGLAGLYTGKRYAELGHCDQPDVRKRSRAYIDQQQDLVLSPNPVTSQLRINIDTHIAELTILDLTGKVMQETIFDGFQTVDVSSLNTGVYFVNIISTDQVSYAQKFIKF